MLAAPDGWIEMVEVNPPLLPDMTHMELNGRWSNILITDNPFKQVRVSPYAYAARITHDVESITPTVVCSTRDRNILAIESEVRGAIGNGVVSFLVVQGDMLPEVEHWSNSYEIVEYLLELQRSMPSTPFEVGMSTRSRDWMFRRRVEIGAQFFTTGPVIDPATVPDVATRLKLRPDDPPVYLELTPPMSARWVRRLERVGAVPVGDSLRQELEAAGDEGMRPRAWQLAREAADCAKESGFAGVVLMGLRFETVIGEAWDAWTAGRP